MIQDSEKEKNKITSRTVLKQFLTKRGFVGILLAVVVLWAGIWMVSLFKKSKSDPRKEVAKSDTSVLTQEPSTSPPATVPSGTHHPATPEDSAHGISRESSVHDAPPPSVGHPTQSVPQEKPVSKSHDVSHSPVRRFPARGMALVDSLIKPLQYELKERFWGWRSNDLIRFTDNVNSFQLGVLEVTRRSAVILAERISRTGSTEAFDKNLENAMNWFMIKPTKYWFPSAESKYKMGLEEFRIYYSKLEKGQAAFYTRTDNLIPLLIAYEDLLGSCDENLVKQREKDGQPVSFFLADEYFFYAKGVASALLTILEAVQQDFSEIVESRKGMEVLHHAIESCRIATKISPWIITNSDLSSIFANHRANMAAPISHARFYLGVLIKALST
jgi:hypothetical protein